MKTRLTIKDKLIFTTLFLLDLSAEFHDYFQNPRAIEPDKLQSDMAGRYLSRIYSKNSLRMAAKRVPPPGIKIDGKKSLTASPCCLA